MLIPRKMSFRKIAGYGLVMCFTLGTTGYLIYKNFIIPYLGADEGAAPTAGIIKEEIFFSDQPVETAVKENVDAVSKKTANNPIDIFANEKFIDLKSGAVIESEVNPQIIGKKNIFEPYNSVNEAEGNMDKFLSVVASSSPDKLSEE